MIDTHTHLSMLPMAEDVAAVLERARLVGVTKYIVPSTSISSSTSSIDLSNTFEDIYAAIGIHPEDASTQTELDYGVMTRLLGAEKLRAIGEVGLDYYYFNDLDEEEIALRKKRQKEVFLQMIALAKENGLPLIVHSREAFADTYQILSELALGHPTVIHCFTGTTEEAKAWLDLGCHISLTGIITFKKNEALREMAKTLPLDRVMLETDSPFLAPEGFRKESCEPRHVIEVAKCLANLLNMTVEAIDEVTTATATGFFNL